MIKFEHRGAKVNSGDLRTPITFYEFAPNEGPEPGEAEQRILYECWAKVEKVWQRDMEQAKANGTLEDVTLKIRDPQADYLPDNRHYIGINDRAYFGKRYNIKTVQPDMQNVGFFIVIAGLVT